MDIYGAESAQISKTPKGTSRGGPFAQYPRWCDSNVMDRLKFEHVTLPTEDGGRLCFGSWRNLDEI